MLQEFLMIIGWFFPTISPQKSKQQRSSMAPISGRKPVLSDSEHQPASTKEQDDRSTVSILDQFSTKDPRSVRYGVTQTPNPSPPLFYALLSGISWIWMLNLLRDLIFTLAYPYGASQSVRIGWGCSVISLSHLNTVPTQAYTAQFPVTLQIWVGGWPLTTSLNAHHTVGQ